LGLRRAEGTATLRELKCKCGDACPKVSEQRGSLKHLPRHPLRKSLRWLETLRYRGRFFENFKVGHCQFLKNRFHMRV